MASRTTTPAVRNGRPTTRRDGAAAALPEPKDAAPLADIGVPSPYALAELIAHRSIDWDAVPNRPALLEQIFQTPYGDLFDPASGSPLYVGQTLRPDGSVVRARPDFARGSSRSKASATHLETDADLTDVRDLAQLVKRLGGPSLADVPVRNAFTSANSVVVELGETAAARTLRFERLFDTGLIDILFPELLGYHPAGFTWQDVGRFYNESTEFLDPVQGYVGDCYVIAAMSSVAWSMPYVIADRTRATGMDNESFVHQIGFHGAHGLEQVEVTDRILVSSGSSVEYAKSKEPGEIWPSVYEKAYAKWRLGEPTDYPAIPNIAGGDPSIACVALTGLSDYRNWHSSFTAAQILQLVKDHTVNGRTTTPMVSWTYGSGEQADVAYRDANVVAGHAYSVLGWMRRNEFVRTSRITDEIIPAVVRPDLPFPGPGPLDVRGGASVMGGATDEFGGRLDGGLTGRWTPGGLFDYVVRPVDYVVLRNPWGYCEGTGSSVAAGAHQARDVDWWRSVPLGTDGVFAMEINAYHRYFAGTGGAH
ncbi:C2 family cysteine protease [Terrabacter sp. Ter38]|uniref:C2 family cysteine protease n=1 Tax=Terrabacter sp. Ter38 TaxID=2926030 RepID=UPI002119338F|nr:C2 family cysteine protease [Terrabacter sp. Ter38]